MEILQIGCKNMSKRLEHARKNLEARSKRGKERLKKSIKKVARNF
jgi:hypothetical protein